MITLITTWNTVVMLLVAGGVGLIGGVAAGLLEIRSDPKKAKKCWKTIASSILLGGVAAVAILYFFPPEETIARTANNTTEVIRQYNLTKLVALALIVGSAGASFLLVLQKRTMDLAEAKEKAVENAGDTQATKVKATEAVLGVGTNVPAAARAGVEGSAQMIERALKEASAAEPGTITPETVATVVKEIGDKAEVAAKQSIDPVVESAQRRILTASMEADPRKDPVDPSLTDG